VGPGDELPHRVEGGAARTAYGQELLALDEVHGETRLPGRRGSRRRDQNGGRDGADGEELDAPHA
jgi:hypothetical protein